MQMPDYPLVALRLDVAVPDRPLVAALDAGFRPGEFVAILGRNGSGKTLTLHTLAGLRPPAGGRVLLDDKPLADWNRRRLARRLALLPQDSEDIFPATVFETALIGRHPHVGTLRLESAADRRLALDALAATGLADLREREVSSLSGGERRRLALSQVLAQAPGIFLLDEPLNHLDPHHQLAILELLRKLVDDGACVLASLHDANLAKRYADRVLLLHGDGDWAFGDCAEMLTADHLGRLFGVGMETVGWRGHELFVPADPASR